MLSRSQDTQALPSSKEDHSKSDYHIDLTESYGAHNYAPLDVVLAKGKGVWVWDVDGKRYMDMLAAYSALNFGHSNPRFIKEATKQLKTLTLTSRAFYNDQFGPFCEELSKFCGMEVVLAMNTGAEAVETAIKCARKWAYEVKKVESEKANIICFENNFAGRTTTIMSFSTSAEGRDGFGPFTPGFKIAKYGDLKSIESLIDKNTAAVLVEPIQGEGGVIIPAQGFLAGLRALCTKHNVLMMADEVQTGLCRSGEIFACDHERVKPDMYIIGKSLGGGIVPISAVISSKNILDVFTPGTHGSTFGGNPFACAIARSVLKYIKEEEPHRIAKDLGGSFLHALSEIKSKKVSAVRAKGLMLGVDVPADYGPAKKVCKELKYEALLCKDTRQQTIRFTPPLVISKKELDWALKRIRRVFKAK